MVQNIFKKLQTNLDYNFKISFLIQFQSEKMIIYLQNELLIDVHKQCNYKGQDFESHMTYDHKLCHEFYCT